MFVRSAAVAALILSTSGVAVAGSTSSGSMVALNPQPEPPGKTGGHIRGIILVALNPQPEPPGATSVTDSARVLGSTRALNPQPEPPGATDARRLPPGPCRNIVVSVAMDGGATVSAHATPTLVSGKCAYDIALPGARPGADVKITISRVR